MPSCNNLSNYSHYLRRERIGFPTKTSFLSEVIVPTPHPQQKDEFRRLVLNAKIYFFSISGEWTGLETTSKSALSIVKSQQYRTMSFARKEECSMLPSSEGSPDKLLFDRSRSERHKVHAPCGNSRSCQINPISRLESRKYFIWPNHTSSLSRATTFEQQFLMFCVQLNK